MSGEGLSITAILRVTTVHAAVQSDLTTYCGMQGDDSVEKAQEKAEEADAEYKTTLQVNCLTHQPRIHTIGL